MKKFWNQPIEFKSFILASLATIVGFLATMFLFWFQRYDIPLAVLLAGTILILTWFFLYLIKKKGQPRIKLDIVLIYLRLVLIVGLAILFAVLDYTLGLVIVSPIILVVSYLVISLITLIGFFRKEEENV